MRALWAWIIGAAFLLGACSCGDECEGDACCVPGSLDCACAAGNACSEGLCRDGRCVPMPVVCGGLRCEEGQMCQERDGVPECVPACGDGQAWNGSACAQMVACADLDCGGQGRLCAGEPFAACTRCDGAQGYVEDGSGGCRLVMGSCDAAEDCPAGEFCLKLDDDPDRPPTCAPAPACTQLAPAGEDPARAWDAARGECVDCISCQGVAGSSGLVWPVTVAGTCICETSPGFYFDDAADARAPRACDADADGWVEFPARNAIESSEVTLRINARCALRKVSAFVLQNERGEQRRVTPGELGANGNSLDLYEPRALDNPRDYAAAAGATPANGSRRYEPSELNPLTKACVDPGADYNQDGLFDMAQSQLDTPRGTTAWMGAFAQLAYFSELHEGHYDGSGEGSYVIAEKRRCAPARFPFDYQDASDYWRECERRRAGSYDPSEPGYDFARFSCDATTGSCPVADVEAAADFNMRDDQGIPLHASCSADAYSTFTGMNHHSQFRCVQFQSVASEAYQLELARVWDGSLGPGGFAAARCGISGAPAEIPNGGGALEAPLSCTTSTTGDLPAGSVGWALARHAPYLTNESYVRGCIDEGVDWPELCPGGGGAGALPQSNAYAFGRIYCGCAPGFGGSSCEEGCPSTEQHSGGIPDPLWSEAERSIFVCDAAGYCANVICQPNDPSCRPGRRGYWMCGDIAASAGLLSNTTNGFSFREARVPVSSFDRSVRLCQNADCAVGFSLR